MEYFCTFTRVKLKKQYFYFYWSNILVYVSVLLLKYLICVLWPPLDLTLFWILYSAWCVDLWDVYIPMLQNVSPACLCQFSDMWLQRNCWPNVCCCADSVHINKHGELEITESLIISHHLCQCAASEFFGTSLSSRHWFPQSIFGRMAAPPMKTTVHNQPESSPSGGSHVAVTR